MRRKRRSRQLAKKLVRAGVDEPRLSWSPGGDAPVVIEASTTYGNVNLEVPRDELPPEEWFTINAIVRDLELLERDWNGRPEGRLVLPTSGSLGVLIGC